MYLLKIIDYLIQIAAILVVITIHEYTKAKTSSLFGDVVPKEEGRLTLNPFKHFEIIGFILFMYYGYGWGKPVRTSSLFYKDRKKDTLITYISPIAVDLLVAVIFGIVLKITSGFYLNSYLVLFFKRLVLYSISLAVFNIIPVRPLCGERILSALVSPNTALKMSQNEKIFQIILITLMILGLADIIIKPIINILYFIIA